MLHNYRPGLEPTQFQCSIQSTNGLFLAFPPFLRICFAYYLGLGITNFIASSIVGVYYNMLIAWTIYYMFASFTSRLPWEDCNNDYNTECKPVYSVTDFFKLKTGSIQFASASTTTRGARITRPTTPTLSPTRSSTTVGSASSPRRSWRGSGQTSPPTTPAGCHKWS